MSDSIFVTQRIPPKAMEMLEKAGRVELYAGGDGPPPKAELLAGVARNDFLCCLLSDLIDADVLAANPALRIVASMSIDGANIDVAAATARRIPVTTIPAMVTQPTADLAWALLMAVARRIVPADRSFRSGVFHGAQSMFFMGSAVHGKTLGIIGFGRIGQAVARRAAGFEMDILYHDLQPAPAEVERRLGARRAPLEEVLRSADYLSLHPVYNPATHHLIGERELGLMKPGAYLINTSRGPVVDEKALVEALRRGELAGAALDVYEHEPNFEPALAEMENVVLSPHLGSAVDETRERMAIIVAENLIAVMDGKRPPNIVNPEIYGEG